MQTPTFDDVPYDPNDPNAIAEYWEGASITLKGKKIGKATNKVPVSLKLSREVIEYFKASGEDWQNQLDDALKAHIADHQKVAGNPTLY